MHLTPNRLAYIPDLWFHMKFTGSMQFKTAIKCTFGQLGEHSMPELAAINRRSKCVPIWDNRDPVFDVVHGEASRQSQPGLLTLGHLKLDNDGSAGYDRCVAYGKQLANLESQHMDSDLCETSMIYITFQN
ncbi:hypothetical protein B0H17DRAFT_1146252 [Mycena rosella]|uniref:Uncharacterized protein n=1 Tax=Mycena rosella TaxID=1033263 RepID=A0AAD7G4P5_MYCRO|nr:hypothetical protein B0H17DRAFT_1146252 [Mycena rosella]